MEPTVSPLWASDLQNHQRKPCALLRYLVRRAHQVETPGNVNTLERGRTGEPALLQDKGG